MIADYSCETKIAILQSAKIARFNSVSTVSSEIIGQKFTNIHTM